VNRRRLEQVVTDLATAPHDDGVLVIDDSGDRKAGTKTAHVVRQYLGSIGKIDGGIVAVTSLLADERVYSSLHATPYTPAARLPKGKADPDFRTTPSLRSNWSTRRSKPGSCCGRSSPNSRQTPTWRVLAANDWLGHPHGCGYTLWSVPPIDLFPQPRHIESASLLASAPAAGSSAEDGGGRWSG
jgi:hypothetical protein